MLFARRLAVLRLFVLAAILASTVLTVDHLRPGREFCPLAEACAAAAQSELGSIGGTPTSMLGLAAFSALFGLTLLPLGLARRLLMPSCFVAALAGMGLIAYQVMHLDAFCPLCLVVDVAAICMGYLALTWPATPYFRTGRTFSAEAASARTAWALSLAVVILAPFAWPRENPSGWEALPESADLAFDDATGADATLENAPGAPEAKPVLASLPPAPAVDTTPVEALAQPLQPSAPPPPAVPELGAAAMVSAHMPAPPDTVAPAADKTKTPTPPPAAKTQVRLVEYLNAFCTHCRATHKRLEQVVDRAAVPLDRRRVYTWNDKGYPLWARACAYAETVGCEDAMFRELTRARGQQASEIHAAARRAGVYGPAYRRAMAERTPPPRLVRDRRIVRAAGLRKLPTFDIGRRRLAGAQSERELHAALQAAVRAVAAE